MNLQRKRFALCLNNSDYEASLILGKVYRIIADERAAQDDLVRIVDESGEDYLYDRSLFAFLDFSESEQDEYDLTAFALQYASRLHPEDKESI